MADVFVYGNRAQLPKLLLQAPCEVSVEGRGTGKSFDIGFKMDAVIRYLPRGICTITGKTFGQLLTRTLPSSLKLLNQIGHQKDFDYVIGRKPPAGFLSSYEALSKFDNVISFRNGTRFVMISLLTRLNCCMNASPRISCSIRPSARASYWVVWCFT